MRASRFITEDACQRFPRAVRIPCLLRPHEIASSVTMPEQLVTQQAQVAAQQQQIAAQQERITQSLAALEALEQEIKQKVSSPPPSRAVTAPPRKPLVSSPQSPAVQPSSGPAQPSARQPLP